MQVVQQIPADEQRKLKELLPSIRRVQVIHVESREALDEIDAYEPHIHAFLLDSGRPNREVPELGGTGRTHDWRISAEFVTKSRKPVYLAGGLSPENVSAAVLQVNPFGLDLCSGIREPNRALNEQKLSAFAHSAHNTHETQGKIEKN